MESCVAIRAETTSVGPTIPLVDNGILRGDQGGNHFCRSDHSAGCGVLELHAVVLEQLVLDIFDVCNQADSHDGERAELGGHHERLRVGIRNNADAHVSGKRGQVVFELAAERGVLDIVDRTMKMTVGLENSQTATVGSQV